MRTKSEDKEMRTRIWGQRNKEEKRTLKRGILTFLFLYCSNDVTSGRLKVWSSIPNGCIFFSSLFLACFSDLVGYWLALTRMTNRLPLCFKNYRLQAPACPLESILDHTKWQFLFGFNFFSSLVSYFFPVSVFQFLYFLPDTSCDGFLFCFFPVHGKW